MLRPDVCWETRHRVEARAPCRQDRWPQRAEGPLCSHCHLQPLSFVWQFPQNLLTDGNGLKLQAGRKKHQLTQKPLQADPTAAGLLRPSCSLV